MRTAIRIDADTVAKLPADRSRSYLIALLKREQELEAQRRRDYQLRKRRRQKMGGSNPAWRDRMLLLAEMHRLETEAQEKYARMLAKSGGRPNK
ncbi:hypothetical protein [Georgenia thermotolerans]|uniref:hypothetical protein n=1 Tax=Georgenia thermotolerans TaxID=527326 RepID=UPI0012644082|nr:hypothetical protein [Georgenia thermotolerans]